MSSANVHKFFTNVRDIKVVFRDWLPLVNFNMRNMLKVVVLYSQLPWELMRPVLDTVDESIFSWCYDKEVVMLIKYYFINFCSG